MTLLRKQSGFMNLLQLALVTVRIVRYGSPMINKLFCMLSQQQHLSKSLHENGFKKFLLSFLDGFSAFYLQTLHVLPPKPPFIILVNQACPVKCDKLSQQANLFPSLFNFTQFPSHQRFLVILPKQWGICHCRAPTMSSLLHMLMQVLKKFNLFVALCPANFAQCLWNFGRALDDFSVAILLCTCMQSMAFFNEILGVQVPLSIVLPACYPSIVLVNHLSVQVPNFAVLAVHTKELDLIENNSKQCPYSFKNKIFRCVVQCTQISKLHFRKMPVVFDTSRHSCKNPHNASAGA